MPIDPYSALRRLLFMLEPERAHAIALSTLNCAHSLIADLIREMGIDGVIATNTTLSRSAVAGSQFADEEGGLSGEPLRPLALQAIGILRATLPLGAPIIAVGGIDSAEAALAALKAGADLVQSTPGSCIGVRG